MRNNWIFIYLMQSRRKEKENCSPHPQPLRFLFFVFVVYSYNKHPETKRLKREWIMDIASVVTSLNEVSKNLAFMNWLYKDNFALKTSWI